MPDLIIMQGDLAIFMPNFGMAMVVVQPGNMQGTGETTHGGKKLCVEGDESKVMVPGCMYTAGPYSIPGVGTLKIAALGGDQTSKKTKSGGKAIIIKGSTFTAKFEVQGPAQQPTATGPVPDGTPQYSGSGQFQTTNYKFKVS